jgi:RHS repeat-associated protein
VLDGSSDFSIGSRRDTLPQYFDGRIDAVGLWKRVPSSGERTSLYNSGAGCHYPFDTCPPPGGLTSRNGWQYSLVPVPAPTGHLGERPLAHTGRLALTNPPAGQTWRLYYNAGGQRVAMRQWVGASSVVYYLVSDHLGSTSLALDSNRAVVAASRYLPYGDAVALSGTQPTDFQFTGQLRDAGIGLNNFGARWYDPYINRFVSPDTIVPGAGNPQALNRYSYALNGPTKYADPTGIW